MESPIECRNRETYKPVLVGLGATLVGDKIRAPIEHRNESKPMLRLRKQIVVGLGTMWVDGLA